MGRTFIFAEWLWEIVKMHFFWIVYLIKGGIILGVFPSTAAMYAVVRHWYMKKKPLPLEKLYKKYYQENFKVANILGWMLLVVTCIIVTNFFYIPYYSAGLRSIMYAVISFFAVILLICWVYIFPTIVHFSFSVPNYFVVILRMGLTSIPGLIMQAFIIGIYLLAIYILPPLLLVFGITPLAFTQMAISYNLFQKLK